MTDPKDTPATPTDDALFMAPERAKIAALLAGTGAMRAAGTKYLPKAPAESEDAYRYRLAVSTLYNGMHRTVETLAGKPFSKPIKLGESVPPDVVAWCEDVDLQGRDLHAFAHAVFSAALADGLSHILVEYPPTMEGATLADKQATGARPYFVHIKHDQILGWRSERQAGAETLIQLRIMETVSEPAGLWLVKKIQQVRVLEPTRWTIYRRNDKDEWVMHEEGVVTLGAVPLATVYCDRKGYMLARPPLLDLADLNIEHWQSSSDQSNILHVARVPILFASGFDEGMLKIGVGSAVSNDDPASKLQYVEHSGAAIEAGRISIKDLEERMSLMGAQLLMKKPGERTATEKAIDSADADSALALMVRNLEDSLEYGLQFMADWEGLGPAGGVECVGEIGGLGDMELAHLLRAKELGLLSAETVFAELQRCGLISDDIEWADETARLKAEGVPPAVGGAVEPVAVGEVPGAGGQGVTSPAPAVDLGPLAEAIKALADKPAAAIDFGPLIQAINAHESTSTMEMDCSPIAAAVAEAIRAIPAAVVNMPVQPAPTIHVDARTTVSQAEQPAPIVNITQSPITVNTPEVTTPVHVVVEKGSGSKAGTMKKQADGSYAMTVNET